MRPIDADFLLYCLKDFEVCGPGLGNRSLTKLFRRLFAEFIDLMPTLTATKIANGYSSTICPVCGGPLKDEEDA